MTDLAPESFGWILKGWSARLVAWEKARATRDAINKRDHPNLWETADWELTSAAGEIASYKAEVVRGLTLAMRWMTEDGFAREWITNLLVGVANEYLKIHTDPLQARITKLERRVEELSERIETLLERNHSEGEHRGQGSEGSGRDQDGPGRPDCACVRGHHGGTSGTAERPVAPPGADLRQGPADGGTR